MKQDVRLRPVLDSDDPQLFRRLGQDALTDIVLRAIGADPLAWRQDIPAADLYTPPPGEFAFNPMLGGLSPLWGCIA